MENQRLIQYDSLIYTVYHEKSIQNMKQDFLRKLYRFIPCTFCSILRYTDLEDMTAACHEDPVCYPDAYTAVENAYMELEEDEKNRWISWEPECKAYRSSDLYQDIRAREQSSVYRVCFAPYGLHFAAYATLCHEGTGIGCLSLYRSKAEGDFTNEEMLILQMLARHLSQRLTAELSEEDAAGRAETDIARKKLLDLAIRCQLTPRETEVLESLTLHQSMEDWARKLHISENTLKKHLQSLYRKTRVNRLMQLYSLKNE